MNTVEYNKVCRSCLKALDGRAVMFVNGDIEPYKDFTEYEFSKILEEWMRRNNNVCDFCGSTYLEGHNIEINGYKLYDFDRLASQTKGVFDQMFILNAVKQYRNIRISTGGKNPHDRQFLRNCFLELYKLLDDMSEDRFIRNEHIGDFYICLSGKYDSETGNFDPVIQRLWCTGLSYEEVLGIINNQIEKFNL